MTVRLGENSSALPDESETWEKMTYLPASAREILSCVMPWLCAVKSLVSATFWSLVEQRYSVLVAAVSVAKYWSPNVVLAQALVLASFAVNCAISRPKAAQSPCAVPYGTTALQPWHA